MTYWLVGDFMIDAIERFVAGVLVGGTAEATRDQAHRIGGGAERGRGSDARGAAAGG